MEAINQEAGPIHKSLVHDQCPKCYLTLETKELTPHKMVRYCTQCNLTIIDDPKTAEVSTHVCD